MEKCKKYWKSKGKVREFLKRKKVGALWLSGREIYLLCFTVFKHLEIDRRWSKLGLAVDDVVSVDWW